MKQDEMNQTQLNIYNNLTRQIDATFKHSHECAFKTRERYQDAMYSFAKFLAVENRKQNISKVNNGHIEKYVVHMQENGYSTSYVTTNISAIRYFYDKQSGGSFLIKSNKELGVNARTKEERIGENRSISDQDYKILLNGADQIGREDFVLKLKVAERFGLRIHEVFALRHSQLNDAIKNSILKVKGKGGLVRSYPLNEKDKDFLATINSYNESKSDRIFIKENEKTHKKIKEMQKFIEKSQNAEKEYTFHSLRHRYAQKLYIELRGKGVSDFEARLIISKRLGHNRISISDIYLN
jgi:site-specific recombinase XerD